MQENRAKGLKARKSREDTGFQFMGINACFGLYPAGFHGFV
jgi:hypothetical protein